MTVLGSSWDQFLGEELKKDYFRQLKGFLAEEYAEGEVYPPKNRIFEAFRRTDYPDVKVVILGQDPYHGKGQADGLAFSVAPGIPLPPSLRNIFKERESDLGLPVPHHGSLEAWADTGVLLLNTVLTVRQGEANSHGGKGWETFTDEVIRCLAGRWDPVVFLLWGNAAQAKKELISFRHTIITSPHPSPLSAHRGFFGSRPFSRANEALEKQGKAPLSWITGP